MNEKRQQSSYVAPVSLNETERKREVDRMNFENKLMLERLNKMAPTLCNAKLESDFKKHLHAESNLRRKQMKPLSLPKDLYRTKEKSSLFDSATYTSQHETSSIMNASNSNLSILQENDSPIKSMKEFRQHVISTKKVAARVAQGGLHSNTSKSPLSSDDMYSATVTNTNNTTTTNNNNNSNRTNSQSDYSRTEALFELSHNPSSLSMRSIVS